MKQYIGWQSFLRDVDYLIRNIEESKKQFKYIYAVPRGGLIVGTILSYKFNLPMLTTVEHMFTKPLMDVLMVDDIVDHGNTLLDFHERGYSIASVYFRKETAKFFPDYYGSIIEDLNWLVFPYDNNPDVVDTISKVREQ